MMTLTSMALLSLISSYHYCCQPSRFWQDSPNILASVLISPAFFLESCTSCCTKHILYYTCIRPCTLETPLPRDVLLPFPNVDQLLTYIQLWQSRMWACSIIIIFCKLRWRPLQLRLPPTPPSISPRSIIVWAVKTEKKLQHAYGWLAVCQYWRSSINKSGYGLNN